MGQPGVSSPCTGVYLHVSTPLSTTEALKAAGLGVGEEASRAGARVSQGRMACVASDGRQAGKGSKEAEVSRVKGAERPASERRGGNVT